MVNQVQPVQTRENPKLPSIYIQTSPDGHVVVRANGEPHILYQMLLKAGNAIVKGEEKQAEKDALQRPMILPPTALTPEEERAALKMVRSERKKKNGK